MDHDIEALWRRIDAALGKHAPAVLETLSGPASAKPLAALERELGQPVPDDLRRAWAVHDGQDDELEDHLLFVDLPFYGVAAARAARKEGREVAKLLGIDNEQDDFVAWHALVDDGIGSIDGPVKARNFNAAWVPIGAFNGDVFRYVDLDPAPGGRVGQVIEVDPESVSWRVLAPSFGDLLARFADALDAGEIDWDEADTSWGTLFPLADEVPMPEYLRAHAPPPAEPVPATGVLDRLAPGERIEVDAEISRMIGGDHCLDVRLSLLAPEDAAPVWARATQDVTTGYRQVTMRATGRCTVSRFTGKETKDDSPPAFVLEKFSRRAKK
ncbi:MAG: SMI1/KNR4 family protein [Pseudomarimonas sp.]